MRDICLVRKGQRYETWSPCSSLCARSRSYPAAVLPPICAGTLVYVLRGLRRLYGRPSSGRFLQLLQYQWYTVLPVHLPGTQLHSNPRRNPTLPHCDRTHSFTLLPHNRYLHKGWDVYGAVALCRHCKSQWKSKRFARTGLSPLLRSVLLALSLLGVCFRRSFAPPANRCYNAEYSPGLRGIRCLRPRRPKRGLCVAGRKSEQNNNEANLPAQ